jgi:DNA-binding NarL/FixJ family response regulator
MKGCTAAEDGLDYTPLLEQIEDFGRQVQLLLGQCRLLLCLGDPALLSLMASQARETGRLLGAVTGATEARTLTRKQSPSLVMLSDQLAEGDAYDLLEWLKSRVEPIQVLLLISQGHRRRAIQRAIRAGCDGVVLQTRFGSGALLAALQALSKGGIYVDRELHQSLHLDREDSGPRQALTERELEVLQALAAGASNQEMGAQLYLSGDTIKTHLSNALRKLPARNRTHAAVLALRWGLIDWPQPSKPS